MAAADFFSEGDYPLATQRFFSNTHRQTAVSATHSSVIFRRLPEVCFASPNNHS
jgi:hypothetical protein